MVFIAISERKNGMDKCNKMIRMAKTIFQNLNFY